jgi:RimJ/RimL family protein N-acetyltransferase
MKLDIATIDDSKDIFEWRNDDHTRAMYVNGERITWEDHKIWYAKILESKKSIIYLGKDEERKTSIGMVRFDIGNNNKNSVVSINLNPIWRGKNVSVELLSSAIKQFRLIHHLPVMAKVKKENMASIKCFERCLFEMTNQDEDFNYYNFS